MNLYERNLICNNPIDAWFCNTPVKVEEEGDVVKITVTKEIFVVNGFKLPSEITFWCGIKNFMYIKEIAFEYEFIFSDIPLTNMEELFIDQTGVVKPFGFWGTIVNGLWSLTLEQTRKNIVEYINSNQNSPILTKE